MTTEVVDMITVVVDGFEVSVPKGTLVIRAAEQLGIQIPRFCDCLLYTSPSPRDRQKSRMPSSA